MTEPNELTPREELLPCPFCGGMPRFTSRTEESHNNRVDCLDCGTFKASTGNVFLAWNRRAYLAATALPARW